MTGDAALHSSLSHELLSELVHGGPGLPSARERWVSLLQHRSPHVRIAAETALLRALRPQASPADALVAAPPRAPHRVPQFGMTEPKRHCLRCFGHDFWVDTAGRLHCDGCEPLQTV